jgi:predicted neuraminidase
MLGEFLHNPGGRGPYCHAPSLLSTRQGTLLAVWYAYAVEEHIGATLVLARKNRDDTQWSKATPLLPSLTASAGNPVLFEDQSGTIWLLFVLLRGNHWNDAELHGAYSADDGLTWSSPQVLSPTPGLMVRHPPIPLADGAWLLPAYDEVRRQAVLLTRHAADGHWRETFRFLDLPLLQPVLVKESDEWFSLFFRPWSDPRCVWRSHSTTQGRQWSTPVRTPLPCPLSGISAFALPDKRVGVVYNHTEQHARYPLSIALSGDCMTWTAPWHVDNINHEVSYPQFTALPDGTVHGVYTYNRRMIKYVRFAPGEL